MAFGQHPSRAAEDTTSFHPEIIDALLGFVYDPADDLLPCNDPDAAAFQAEQLHCAKRHRAHHADDAALFMGFVRGPDARTTTGVEEGRRVQSAAAKQRLSRIREKTAELSRLVPGGHRLNTAEMLEEAARHVKLLQAQIGILALMRTHTQVNYPSFDLAFRSHLRQFN